MKANPSQRQLRPVSCAVKVRRRGPLVNSGDAATGPGTIVGLRLSSVPEPVAAGDSVSMFGITTRRCSYALKAKLQGGRCLTIVGTEGATHLPTVLPVTPMAVATAVGAWPSASTRRTSSARLCGVRRAFLWMFIRSPVDTEASQPQLPRSGPDGQPIESSHLGEKLGQTEG